MSDPPQSLDDHLAFLKDVEMGAKWKTPTELIAQAINDAVAEHPGKWLHVVVTFRQTEDGSGLLDELKIIIDPPHGDPYFRDVVHLAHFDNPGETRFIEQTAVSLPSAPASPSRPETE